MARIKKEPVMIEFTAEYAGKQAGYKGSFMPDLAAAIVQSGNAQYITVVKNEVPAKETKLKTTKSKVK